MTIFFHLYPLFFYGLSNLSVDKFICPGSLLEQLPTTGTTPSGGALIWPSKAKFYPMEVAPRGRLRCYLVSQSNTAGVLCNSALLLKEIILLYYDGPHYNLRLFRCSKPCALREWQNHNWCHDLNQVSGSFLSLFLFFRVWAKVGLSPVRVNDRELLMKISCFSKLDWWQLDSIGTN